MQGGKEKALCTTADQSKAQRAVTANHHREASKGIIPTSRQENKEEIYNDQQENGEREAGGHASHLGNER